MSDEDDQPFGPDSPATKYMAKLYPNADLDESEPVFLGESQTLRALAILSWRSRAMARLKALSGVLPRRRGRRVGSGRKLPNESPAEFLSTYLKSARSAGRHWTRDEYADRLGVDRGTLDAHVKRLGFKGWPPN